MPAENGQPENIATAVTEVSERVTVLIREEIELAKVEMTQKVASMARAAAAVAAGAVFGVFALIFGLLAVAWGLNDIFNHPWPGFLIVFGVLGAMALAAFLFAWRKFKVATPPAPTMAIDEAKKIRATVAAKQDGQ